LIGTGASFIASHSEKTRRFEPDGRRREMGAG
jgi:hypothetical protein